MKLKEEYKKLWLKHSTPAHLERILQQFDWLAQFFTEKSVQVKNENFDVNPNIPSEWIFHLKHRKKGAATHSYFRKRFQVPKNTENICLQVIGDTHVKVHVNGTIAHEFYSKRTLSVRMLDTMIGLIDISEYCKPGDNTITIENINYLGGYGIVNIYGEIFLQEYNQKIILKSDKSWEATHVEDKEWIAGKESSLIANEPKSLGPPPLANGYLSYPKFDENIPSHHTKLLGFTNYELLVHAPRYLTWLLRWMSKMALKRGLLI